MDDMIGSMTGDALLRRRLEAYADTRLSPDLATSSRLRARVLAVAHRHAALARADAGLTVLSRPGVAAGALSSAGRAQELLRASGRRRRTRWHRAAGIVLAASLAVGLAAGGVLAARPGGPLYDARLYAETLTLPADPSARAVAELDRIKDRLQEIAEASRVGDATGATAALAAYEIIVDQASASAILAGDEVAAAVLETGIGRNVEVLRALMGRVPAQAGAAISRALEAAIARSAAAVDRIDASRPGGGRGDGAGTGQPAGGPGPRATKAPTAKPTAAPTATPKPKPTHEATSKPTKAPDGMPAPREDDQAEPTPPGSPKPDRGGGPTIQGD